MPPSKAAVAQRMGFRAHELAAAMSHGTRVSVETWRGQLVEGAVTRRFNDASLPLDPKDPSSSRLVYEVGGQRVLIGDVKSVGAAR
jgi:hypothetical protein